MASVVQISKTQVTVYDKGWKGDMCMGGRGILILSHIPNSRMTASGNLLFHTVRNFPPHLISAFSDRK